MKNTLKVGNKIQYRGCFGSGAVEVVTVESIEVTEGPREKYGHNVEECDISVIRENRANLSLSNGHWCYSDQVVRVL